MREAGGAGAFVTVLVPTAQITEAIAQARAALERDGYEILDIDRALRFDPEEWEPNGEIPRCVRKVLKSGTLGYSTFQTWDG